jgi:hypothetical protein
MLAEDTTDFQNRKIAILQDREPTPLVKKEDNPPKILWGDWKKKK